MQQVSSYSVKSPLLLFINVFNRLLTHVKQKRVHRFNDPLLLLFNWTQSCTFTYSCKESLNVKLEARGLCNGGFVAGLLNRRSTLPSLPSSLYLSPFLSLSISLLGPPTSPPFHNGGRWLQMNPS